MDGWIALHRKLASNPLWTLEPFTSGQAWVDLLLLANHRPGEIMVRGIIIPIDRGQVGHSEITLAERWKWSRGKVRRYIDSLRKRKMVSTQQDNKTTIITILNYDEYQKIETANGTANGTASGTASGQQTDTNNKENNENKKRQKENIPHGSAVTVQTDPPFYLTKKKRKLTGKRLEAFDRFWKAFAYPKGKAEAADAWLDIPTLTDSLVDEIVKAAEGEALARPKVVASGQTPKWAQGWISGRRWEDEATIANRELSVEEQTARDLAEFRRMQEQGGGQ